MSTRVLLAASALVCLVGTSARADDTIGTILERARLHYQAGEKLYLLGRYPDALREFQDGYALAPRPEFLLNLGQVHRKLGDRATATSMFEKFLLSTEPDDPRRLAVQDILRELRVELEAEREPSVVTLPVRPTPTAAVPRITADPAGDAEPRWYRDWIGGALMGAGLTGVAVGSGLAVSANADIGDANLDLDRYLAARDATTTRTVGLVVLGAGSALVVGAVIRYITHDR